MYWDCLGKCGIKFLGLGTMSGLGSASRDKAGVFGRPLLTNREWAARRPLWTLFTLNPSENFSRVGSNNMQHCFGGYACRYYVGNGWNKASLECGYVIA